MTGGSSPSFETLLGESAVAFSEALAAALQAGRLTDEEAEELERRRLQLDAEVKRLFIRSGRVSA